jgi:RimJ/RimL family protein N-acetyltransferase
VLETSRLSLRELRPADAAELTALDTDPEVAKYIETPSRVDRPGCLAVVEKSTGDLLGWVELADREHGVASLGYRLHRKAWGKGYATEAARALIAHGFTDPGLRRIVASTMSVNTRSRAVLAKAGLRHVRTFWGFWEDPIDGAEFGDVDYELHRTNYIP